jgi:hypothetical protein
MPDKGATFELEAHAAILSAPHGSDHAAEPLTRADCSGLIPRQPLVRFLGGCAAVVCCWPRGE